MEKQRAYLSNLDLLRFLAALYVVGTHYGFIGPNWGMTGYSAPTGWISEVLRLGYVGVPIFFALSGFLIAHVSQKTDAIRFGVNRVFRLMPGFWCSMTVSFIVLMLLGSAHDVSVKTWFANLILLPQALGEPFVDGVYWTLVYEFVFYAWATIFILFGVFHRYILLIGGVWLAIAAANLFVLDSAILDRVLITKFAGSFIVGMCYWHLFAKGRSLFAIAIIVLATLHQAFGLQIASAQEYLINPPEPLSTMASIAVSALIMGVVAWGIFGKQIQKGTGLLVTLGGISYPLYLIHQEIGYAVFRHLAFLEQPLLLALTMTLLMIALAWLIHVFGETPLRRLLQAVFGPIIGKWADRIQAIKPI